MRQSLDEAISPEFKGAIRGNKNGEFLTVELKDDLFKRLGEILDDKMLKKISMKLPGEKIKIKRKLFLKWNGTILKRAEQELAKAQENLNLIKKNIEERDS